MIDNQKAISPSWTWALAAIALVAVMAAALISMASGPASAADPGTCDPGRPHDAGSFPDETIMTSDGLQRDYILHIPPSYTGTEMVPVVFNFHGLGGTASGQQLFSGLPAKADTAGFIVVAPQGLTTETEVLPDPIAHWNIVAAPPETGQPDDVAFIAELLDALESQLCVDSARVYSTGMSNGAQMSVRLACSLSERIAAFAPVAGVYFPPVSVDIAPDESCPDTRPASIIAFHGTADPIIPFDGGPGIFDFTFRDIDDEILPQWAERNGCASVPTDEQVTKGVRLVRYEECDQGATVELYVIEGGGHTWPATPEISATDLMWEFFQAHALAAAQEPTPTPTPAATTSPSQPTATALPALPTTGTGAGDGSGGAGVLAGIIAGISAAAIALGGAAWWLRRRRLYSS